MDFQSLTMLYAGKKDEELLQLAEESDQLTFEAQSALRGEMASYAAPTPPLRTATTSSNPEIRTGVNMLTTAITPKLQHSAMNPAFQPR